MTAIHRRLNGSRARARAHTHTRSYTHTHTQIHTNIHTYRVRCTHASTFATFTRTGTQTSLFKEAARLLRGQPQPHKVCQPSEAAVPPAPSIDTPSTYSSQLYKHDERQLVTKKEAPHSLNFAHTEMDDILMLIKRYL